MRRSFLLFYLSVSAARFVLLMLQASVAIATRDAVLFRLTSADDEIAMAAASAPMTACEIKFSSRPSYRGFARHDAILPPCLA
jgi:hypothetical protein